MVSSSSDIFSGIIYPDKFGVGCDKFMILPPARVVAA
jgi:hypothetical protein